MKPKHQRLIFVAVCVCFLVVAALLTLRAFRDNLVFFYNPSELAGKTISADTLIRVGGLVQSGSVVKNSSQVSFKVEDGAANISVSYQGMLPSLFREGQGVVVEGNLQEDGALKATKVLTKHDENYMPKEVVETLKKSGRWQETR